tara:strand:+ start:2672 stop:2806 length:135 start_codon:yes stop_codon:yes gene_type:complete
MKDKEYIQWLEERIVRLEVELHEAKKKESIINSINQFNQQWQKS